MKISKEKHERSQADVKELYETAYNFYSAGKYTEAEHLFRLLTTQDLKNIDYWMGLAAAMQLQGKYREAVDAFAAAALFDKEECNPYPHLHAAESLFALNEKEKANIALNSALIIAKKDQKHHPLIEKIQFLQERWTHG